MNALPRGTDDLVGVVCAAIQAIQRTLRGVAARTATLIGEPVAPGEPPALAHAACVTLLSPEHGLELRIACAGDVGALVAKLFGSASDLHAVDLLAELANLGMGALKVELGDLAFTSGVPERLPVFGFRDASFAYADELALDCGVAVRIGLRSQRARAVLPRELREGMVLAGDLRNPQGVLLAPSGTRLSQHMLDRVVGALAPGARIEVSVA